ncbi:DUF1287 domain-containing protein [Syntrophomonas erecta]
MTGLKKKALWFVTLTITLVLVLWYLNMVPWCGPGRSTIDVSLPSPVEQIPPEKRTTPDLILLGARQEVKNGTRYDASYQVINYPAGDVAPDRGACTDVVVRALRNAGIDLQVLIHEDMLEKFSVYPANWGLSTPDPNIDHRRVPNQVTFFRQYAQERTRQVQGHEQEWKWGDIVYWRFNNGDEHCGIVSDRLNRQGIPLVIHNAGITKEENCLTRWEITGHFRYPPETQPD